MVFTTDPDPNELRRTLNATLDKIDLEADRVRREVLGILETEMNLLRKTLHTAIERFRTEIDHIVEDAHRQCLPASHRPS